MLEEGSYVRMIAAPESRRGTIHEAINYKGKPQFLFRLDRRFKESFPDVFIYPDEVEECGRPGDAEIERINKLVARAD
jgi:hypothetical protein